MQCLADRSIRMMKELSTQPFENVLSNEDIVPSHTRTKPLEIDNDVLKLVTNFHENSDIHSQTEIVGDTKSEVYALDCASTNGVEGSTDILHFESAGQNCNGLPTSYQASNALLSQGKGMAETDITTTNVFSGGKYVEWVEHYAGKLSSSSYKVVWTNPGLRKRIIERRRTLEKKHLFSFTNDQYQSKCILYVETNIPLFENCPTSLNASESLASELRIGSKYQAAVNKAPISSRRLHIESLPILMWDPRQANDAMQNGEDIDAFLSKSENLNLKLLLMESLHKSHYHVSIAKKIFVSTYGRTTRYSHEYIDSEKISHLFESDHFAQTKDFGYIARKFNCSKELALVNYYRWKKSKPNNPEQYLRMKSERNKESDVCKVCDNGGNLIVCDLCNKAYHFSCLTPPLTTIPHEEWFCPDCETRSPAKLRRHSGYQKMISPSLAGVTPNIAVQSDYLRRTKRMKESLKLIHKELLRSVKRPKVNSAMELSPARPKTKIATYSPAGMTWDSALGYWTKSTISEDRQSSSTVDKSVITTFVDNNGSTSNPAEDDVAQCDLTKNRDNYTSLENSVEESSKGTPILLRGESYIVRLPITPEGLLIFIEKKSDRFTSFSGYRKSSTGEMGYAEKVNAFRANGDFILEVDNISCFDKSFSEVRSMLKVSEPGLMIRSLKMFHPYNVNS